MLPLEKIAENPRAATISENLVLVADPFEDAKKRGILSPAKIDEVISALKDHFVYGASLIERFHGDLVSIESSMTHFDRMVVANAFEMLKILLENRPDELEKRMAKLYRDNRPAFQSGKKPKDLLEDLFKLLKYTHEWRHFIEKRRGIDHFVALEHVPLNMGTFYIRDNPNKGYPNYALYAWFERVKTKARIISKILYQIFGGIEDAKGRKEKFYEIPFVGRDYFGVRAIGSGQEIMGRNPEIRQKVERIFSPTGTSPWVCTRFEDYRQTDKEVRTLKYSLEYNTSEDQKPVGMQLQVFTLTDLLLGDFFLRDARAKFEVRRNSELAAYERQNPKLYRRMREAIANVLTFLPK